MQLSQTICDSVNDSLISLGIRGNYTLLDFTSDANDKVLATINILLDGLKFFYRDLIKDCDCRSIDEVATNYFFL